MAGLPVSVPKAPPPRILPDADMVQALEGVALQHLSPKIEQISRQIPRLKIAPNVPNENDGIIEIHAVNHPIHGLARDDGTIGIDKLDWLCPKDEKGHQATQSYPEKFTSRLPTEYHPCLGSRYPDEQPQRLCPKAPAHAQGDFRAPSAGRGCHQDDQAKSLLKRRSIMQ
jgi:hypothetical protein